VGTRNRENRKSCKTAAVDAPPVASVTINWADGTSTTFYPQCQELKNWWEAPGVPVWRRDRGSDAVSGPWRPVIYLPSSGFAGLLSGLFR
jgi:hypothetical protein